MTNQVENIVVGSAAQLQDKYSDPLDKSKDYLQYHKAAAAVVDKTVANGLDEPADRKLDSLDWPLERFPVDKMVAAAVDKTAAHDPDVPDLESDSLDYSLVKFPADKIVAAAAVDKMVVVVAAVDKLVVRGPDVPQPDNLEMMETLPVEAYKKAADAAADFGYYCCMDNYCIPAEAAGKDS